MMLFPAARLSAMRQSLEGEDSVPLVDLRSHPQCVKDILRERIDELSPEPAPVAGADGGVMDGAAPCRVGNRINMTHSLNWKDGKCKECGWTYPKLLHL